MLLRRLLCILVLIAPSLSHAQGSPPYTQVWMNSFATDPLVRQQYRYFAPAPNIWVIAGKHLADDGVRVTAGSSWPPFWQLDFAPESGRSFGLGVYSNAEKYGMNMPGHPGMDISLNMPGHPDISFPSCGRLLGTFTVLEIERDTTGNIVRLAIDFEQRCEFIEGGLYGNVRFNSNVPWEPPYIPPPAVASIQLYGDPGVPASSFNNDPQRLMWARQTSDNAVRMSVLLPSVFPLVEYAAVSLQAPAGSALRPGLYESATKIGATTGPGLDFLLGPTSCATIIGKFVVHEVDIDPYGYIRKLAADFELHCNGAVQGTFGSLRYNSSIPSSDPRQIPGWIPIVIPVTFSQATLPTGKTVSLSLSAPVSSCTLAKADFVGTAAVQLPMPTDMSYPNGVVDFRAENCGSGQAVTFTVDVGEALPSTAQWWKYGPTPDNHAAHWYAIPSTVSGSKIRFTIADGGLGDDDLMMNGSISDLGMVAIPGGIYQDLWWSGLAENGWGMSIVQHRDVLFANVFAYDSQGAPTWYVMPSGSWNDAHTAYTGNLYLPRGSPFYAYDAAKFDIGAPVGTATFTFADVNTASFDYTIDGITGHKNITRLHFGPQDAPTDKPLGDLWWAGSQQNGWGIALMQQYSSLFGLWFTYDADGKPTWFVMPAGSWVMKDDYQGKIYKTDGPPWLGVPYDASRHHTTEAGTFRLRFGTDTATFDYTVDSRSGSISLTRIPF